jgi:electron transport complex protein RnfB
MQTDTPQAPTPAAAQACAGVGLLAQRLHQALPQTQCTRCGFPDCQGYAQAMAEGSADINQCPPGGHEGVQRLAAILQRPAIALNPHYGHEQARLLAVIDEANCIGCTLCIQACPVDAIVGLPKHMHTVIPDACTGCNLCVEPCPVDCIQMLAPEPPAGTSPQNPPPTGWRAWSETQAQNALFRYQQRNQRLRAQERQRQDALPTRMEQKLTMLEESSSIQDACVLATKRQRLEAMLEQARKKRQGITPASPS